MDTSSELYLPSNAGEVVRVDGLCYELVGEVDAPPEDIIVDGVFETCAECESSTSLESSDIDSSDVLGSSNNVVAVYGPCDQSSGVPDTSSLIEDSSDVPDTSSALDTSSDVPDTSSLIESSSAANEPEPPPEPIASKYYAVVVTNAITGPDDDLFKIEHKIWSLDHWGEAFAFPGWGVWFYSPDDAAWKKFEYTSGPYDSHAEGQTDAFSSITKHGVDFDASYVESPIKWFCVQRIYGCSAPVTEFGVSLSYTRSGINSFSSPWFNGGCSSNFSISVTDGPFNTALEAGAALVDLGIT